MRRMMVVDDDPMIVQALETCLGAMFPSGLRLETFTDPASALDRLRQVTFDVIVSDYRMPYIDGIQFLQTAGAVQPHVVRLMLSAASDFEVMQQAINDAEVYRFLAKPWKDPDLFRHIGDALRHAEQSRNDRELADNMRMQRGELTPAELEMRRLEEQEPGLTVVEWGPNGEVIMPDLPELSANDLVDKRH